MEKDQDIDYINHLRKVYFDTYIETLLKENELRLYEERSKDLIKNIAKFEAENFKLKQLLTEYDDYQEENTDSDNEIDSTKYTEVDLNYEDNKSSENLNENTAIVENEVQSKKKYSLDQMRLYCFSLKQTTTEETLFKYFSQFGKVIDVSLPLCNKSGLNRTYAFITFESYEKFPLDHNPHLIDGVYISVTKLQPTNGVQKTNFLLVNGVLNNINEKDLKNYFSKYGTVLSVQKERKKSENYKIRFAYIKFASNESVDMAIKQTIHEINHHIVDIRKCL